MDISYIFLEPMWHVTLMVFYQLTNLLFVHKKKIQSLQ